MSFVLAFIFALLITGGIAKLTWKPFVRNYRPWWGVALFGTWSALTLLYAILTGHWYAWVEFVFFTGFLCLTIHSMIDERKDESQK